MWEGTSDRRVRQKEGMRRPSLSCGMVRHRDHASGDDHLEVFAVELGTDLRQKGIVSERYPLLEMSYNGGHRISRGTPASKRKGERKRRPGKGKDTRCGRKGRMFRPHT